MPSENSEGIWLHFCLSNLAEFPMIPMFGINLLINLLSGGRNPVDEFFH